MSGIAQELDAALQRIDPREAERITRLVRGILLLAETPAEPEAAGLSSPAAEEQLLGLAAYAEPMGVLTNSEIDQALYGR